MITKRAWLRAARAFVEAQTQYYTDRQQEPRTTQGICAYLKEDCYDALSNFQAGCGIKTFRLLPVYSDFLPGGKTAWSPECDEIRSLLCCFFAAMTPQERREMFADE